MADYAVHPVQPLANAQFDTTTGAMVTTRAEGCSATRVSAGLIEVTLTDPGVIDIAQLDIQCTAALAGGTILTCVSVLPVNTSGKTVFRVLATIAAAGFAATDCLFYLRVNRCNS